MQLPGMSYDPVRLSLDVTWWPDEDAFGVSRRLWTRPHRGDTWQLEDMATNGSLRPLCSLRTEWAVASEVSIEFFERLVRTQGEPF